MKPLWVCPSLDGWSRPAQQRWSCFNQPKSDQAADQLKPCSGSIRLSVKAPSLLRPAGPNVTHDSSPARAAGNSLTRGTGSFPHLLQAFLLQRHHLPGPPGTSRTLDSSGLQSRCQGQPPQPNPSSAPRQPRDPVPLSPRGSVRCKESNTQRTQAGAGHTLSTHSPAVTTAAGPWSSRGEGGCAVSLRLPVPRRRLGHRWPPGMGQWAGAQYLVLLHSPGSQGMGRRQLQAETDLWGHRAHNYQPSAGWPPPHTRMHRHGSLPSGPKAEPSASLPLLTARPHCSNLLPNRKPAPATNTETHPLSPLWPSRSQEPEASRAREASWVLPTSTGVPFALSVGPR